MSTNPQNSVAFDTTAGHNDKSKEIEMANTELTPSFQLFDKSKKLVLGNINTFGLLFLLPFLVGLFTNIRSRHLAGFERFSTTTPGFGLSVTTVGFGVLVGLIVLVISVVANLMLYVLELESTEGKKPGLKELWPVIQKFGVRLVGLSIVIVLVIFAGLVALIVPGLIFIRRYYLAPYVMIDRDLSISESMKESARISKPHSGSVWGLLGVSIVLGLPSIVPFIGWVVSFVLTSLYAVAPALRYRELVKLSPK